VNRRVDNLEPFEGERSDERRHANEQFGRAEPDDRLTDAIGQPPDDEGPERKTGHERGQHGARRVNGDAEHEAEEPRPEDLIGERAEPGEKQQGRDQPDIGAALDIPPSPRLVAGVLFGALRAPRTARRTRRNGFEIHVPSRIAVRASSSSPAHVASPDEPEQMA
jgi:hypothetical protein